MKVKNQKVFVYSKNLIMFTTEIWLNKKPTFGIEEGNLGPISTEEVARKVLLRVEVGWEILDNGFARGLKYTIFFLQIKLNLISRWDVCPNFG